MASYTAEQVYDALIRQGIDEKRARAMAAAIGNDRVSPEQIRRGYQAIGAQNMRLPEGDDGKQDSNLVPNALEGAAFALGTPYLANRWKNVAGQDWKNMARGAGRFLGPMALGSAGNIAGAVMSGTNYYDRSTDAQIGADIAGSIAGGLIGDKYGEGLGKKFAHRQKAAEKLLSMNAEKLAAAKAAEKGASSAVLKKAAQTAGKKAASGLGLRLLGGSAGRALGGVLGAAGGPIGSMVLGTALGYALPKLLPDGSKAVNEDDELHTAPAQREEDYATPFGHSRQTRPFEDNPFKKNLERYY